MACGSEVAATSRVAPDDKLTTLETNGASEVNGAANVDTKNGTYTEENGGP